MSGLDTGTIVAVATAEGRGGLAVVRLSGPRALAIARRLLPGGELAEPVDSHRTRLALVCWPDGAAEGGHEPGEALDQALILPLIAPASYTGEDTVEFFCHGGRMPAKLVAAACRAAGARAAGAGEFTRRAFLNGRLSLAQAEAVADLIACENAAGARAALAQLRGGLNRQIAAIEAPLRSLLVDLEGSLEFEEHEQAAPAAATIREVLNAARQAVRELLALSSAGRQLREGVQVVIAGPPNAGKSSLFNALLGRPRALVDGRPGTTRDVITAPLEIEGILFVLHDTAGLWAGAEGVEAMGVDRALQALDEADIILDLLPVEGAQDAAAQGAPTDELLAEPVRRTPAGSGRLLVRTKGDLGPADGDLLVTSARTGQGIAELKRRMLAEARRRGLEQAVSQGVLLNERHQDRLRSCLRALDELSGEPLPQDEVVASILSTAVRDLGEIGGRVFSEQLLGEIFSRFCVGK